MKLLRDGSYSIEDKIAIDGEGVSPFIFGRGWLLEILDLKSGEFFFLGDGEEIHPRSMRFGIFYPPFTIIRSFVRKIKGRVRGVGSTRLLPRLPSTPLIFETDFDEPFIGADQAIEILDLCRHSQSIEMNTRPSLLSLKAKRLIDENFLIYPSISRIADRLGVSHAHLSRQFKRDYQMSPSAYLHALRVAEATFRLSIGEEIIDISYDVGYNDLSRFYKQFHKKTQTSPAICRALLKSNRV
jgi:AraC-like DNA-binding protein